MFSIQITARFPWCLLNNDRYLLYHLTIPLFHSYSGLLTFWTTQVQECYSVLALPAI